MATKLKHARQEAGLTLQQVADEANVSRATVNNAERNQLIRIEYAHRIVSAINKLAGTFYTVDELDIHHNS